MVIVQHMPPGFTRSLAARLDAVSAMEVVEAEPGMKIQPGRALIAPGGSHVHVRQVRGALEVEVAPGPRVNGHCPSVDILFQSVHAALGGNAVGVLLTGMGRDGAEGLKRLRDAGATTLVQDEASSVVYGMAREAVELEAAEQIVPLGMLARHIVAAATGPAPQPGVARASLP
jgi:two-component system chemotaxis response regulator CheB